MVAVIFVPSPFIKDECCNPAATNQLWLRRKNLFGSLTLKAIFTMWVAQQQTFGMQPVKNKCSMGYVLTSNACFLSLVSS